MHAESIERKNLITVLLVDDSSAFLESTMKTLKRNPFIKIVDVAFSSEDALRAAEKHKPMVILLDVEMPDRSGIDTIQPLKALLPETKVIILTLFDNIDYRNTSKSAGADAFITKAQIVRELCRQLKLF